MSASKTLTDAKLSALEEEKARLTRSLQQAETALQHADAPPSATEEGSGGGGSIASSLADALAHPPAYLSAGDPATSGLYSKMVSMLCMSLRVSL